MHPSKTGIRTPALHGRMKLVYGNGMDTNTTQASVYAWAVTHDDTSVQGLFQQILPQQTSAARLSHILTQEQFHSETCRKDDTDVIAQFQATMKRALMHEVMPAVSAGLVALVEERPSDSIQFLSDFLIKWSDDQVSARVDPYDAPIYAERSKLVAEKTTREEGRANASVAKRQREKAARAEADANLHNMLVDSMRKHVSMLRS